MPQVSRSALRGESSRWIPESEYEIKSGAEYLQKAIRRWAKAYASQSLGHIAHASKQSKEAFLQEVQKSTAFRDIKSVEHLSRPFLLLAALLSEHIRRRILINPYFHFEPPQIGAGGQAQGFSFACISRNILYSLINDGDPERANSVRRTIFRQEFPEDQSPECLQVRTDRVICPTSVTEDVLRQNYEEIQDEFLRGPSTLLRRGMDDGEYSEMRKGLQRLLWQAGNIHICLMTHPASFSWMDPQHVIGRKYKARSKEVIPDTSQSDGHLGNKEIQMVVATGLSVTGNSLGQEFHQTRVVAPSLVCLAEEESNRRVLCSQTRSRGGRPNGRHHRGISPVVYNGPLPFDWDSFLGRKTSSSSRRPKASAKLRLAA